MWGLQRLVLGVIAAFVLTAGSVCGQNGMATGDFSQDELDQLLAPIALYPDQLLSQILIAATYPLEVVQAARFVQQNPALAGDALDEALAERNWDPSIQSLAAFPQVLAMMNDRLDWTERLGDAFLSDPQRVMDTVQSLRRRAQAAGNLASTSEQSVSDVDQAIVIVPARPDVIYVPVYDPLVIYGAWWAPAYPPWFWFPPPIYGYAYGGVVGIVFGGGHVVSHNHWGWSHPDWRRHDIAIHPGNNRFWNVRGHAPPPGGAWRHSPDHRHGVAYPNGATRDRFAPVDPNAVRARENFRAHELAPAGGAAAPRPQPSASGHAEHGTPPPAWSRSSGTTLPPATSRPVAPPRPVSPPPSQVRPSPGTFAAPAPPPHSVLRPAAPAFDPGISRQQAQTNAQRGLQSRQSMPAMPPRQSLAAPAPTSRAPAPSVVNRAPAAPAMNRAPAAPAMNRAPAPGNAPSPPRTR